MPIPKLESRWRIFLRESFVYDIGIALMSGVAAALKATEGKTTKEARFDGLFWCAVGVCFFAVAKATVGYATKHKQKSIHELEGCLHAMQAYLVAEGGDNVRVTIHIPINDGQDLEQLVEYIGCKPNKKAGRVFPAQSGVIGRAFREKLPISVARKNDNHADYIRELISDYHYTEEDAQKCSAGTYSWLAIPLFKESSNDVEGIVYADSSKKDFFSDEISENCVAMCAGIARFISQRY